MLRPHQLPYPAPGVLLGALSWPKHGWSSTWKELGMTDRELLEQLATCMKAYIQGETAIAKTNMLVWGTVSTWYANAKEESEYLSTRK